MLKKIYRIAKTKEYSKIMKSGKVAFAPSLMLKILPNSLPHARFGIIVSNKVSKRATKRNLIKRRLSEIIRLAISKIKPGFDIVIIASPKCLDAKAKVLAYSILEQDLKTALRKARLI